MKIVQFPIKRGAKEPQNPPKSQGSSHVPIHSAMVNTPQKNSVHMPKLEFHLFFFTVHQYMFDMF